MLTGTVTEVRVDASGRRRSTCVTIIIERLIKCFTINNLYHAHDLARSGFRPLPKIPQGVLSSGGPGLQVEGAKRGPVNAGEAPTAVPTPEAISLRGAALLSPVAEKDSAGQQSSRCFQCQVANLPPPRGCNSVVLHGTERIHGNSDLPVKGPVQYRTWALRTPTGETLSAAGCIDERSALDIFLLIFPSLQLKEMRRLTNR
jgi:hypothetical protein